MKRIAMAVIDRANWGRLQPLAERMGYGPEASESYFRLTLLCGGSTVLERFKRPVDEMHCGHHWDVEELSSSELEGDTPTVKARSLGLTTMDYAAALDRIKPDCLILIGDRYEALGVACAAVTLRIPLVHIQGGEVSGALDERYRHAISKLADHHVPATQRAADNLIRMGERPESILTIGCPSSDMARHVKIGSNEQPYLLVVYHPNTTHSETATAEMEAVLKGVAATGIRAKVFWPNIDSGSGAIAKVIRQHQDDFETIKNLPPLEYATLLANAACCVGNSSSFVRDSGFYGTPVVLVGSRQDGRECGGNVSHVRLNKKGDYFPCDAFITAAVLNQCMKYDPYQGKNVPSGRRYPPSTLYGDGHVCERIVKALLGLPPYSQKRLAYEVEMEWKRGGSDSAGYVYDWCGAE